MSIIIISYENKEKINFKLRQFKKQH